MCTRETVPEIANIAWNVKYKVSGFCSSVAENDKLQLLSATGKQRKLSSHSFLQSLSILFRYPSKSITLFTRFLPVPLNLHIPHFTRAVR